MLDFDFYQFKKIWQNSHCSILPAIVGPIFMQSRYLEDISKDLLYKIEKEKKVLQCCIAPLRPGAFKGAIIFQGTKWVWVWYSSCVFSIARDQISHIKFSLSFSAVRRREFSVPNSWLPIAFIKPPGVSFLLISIW